MPGDQTRRRWMLGALASALTLRAADPAIEFPSDPRQRIAVSSLPFRKIPLLEFPKAVVERFNIHGVELFDEHFPETGGEYLDDLRTVLQVAGVRVVNLAVDKLPGSIYHPDEQRDTIERARDWVDIAETLASPAIRLRLPVSGEPAGVQTAANALKIAADYGEAKHVVVHLECQDPAFLIAVIKAAGTPWLRALPDLGDAEKTVTALFRQAYGICHIPSAPADLPKMLAIAKSAGYHGYFSMMCGAEDDPFETTRRLIESTLKALA